MGIFSAEEDLFGNLPDEILGCIVTFLPNENSLETSLISTRWRNLWNQVLVKHGTLQDIAHSVSEFLSCFDELDPLKHPRKLRFHHAEQDDDKRSESLILAATIATNKKLLLDFSCGKRNQHQSHYDLQFMFQNSVPSSGFLVKTLHLKSVTCLTSEAASSMVSNLEHLENLVISDCSGLRCLCIESESKLRKLTILDCLHLMYLHLRTSKLKSLTFRGILPRIWPESHFNLSEARLDFRLGPSSTDFNSQSFDQTLLTIKNSQVLTLCKWTFEALIWPSISSSGNFIFYRLRELWWIESHMDENSIDVLTSFLKLCPALELLYLTIDPKSYEYAGPGSDSGMMQTSEHTLELQNLKLIKLLGFTSEVDEISVATKLINMVKGKAPKIETSDGSCLVIMH